MRWGPWVSTSILGFFVGSGVLVLFIEAFHVRRRSDNTIHKLSIMMFTIHSASWVIGRRQRLATLDWFWRMNCKMLLIFEIGVAVVYWNTSFACGCAIWLCLCTVWMPNVFRVQEKRSKIAVAFVDRAVGFRSASLWLVEAKPFFGNHIWFWLLGQNTI